jgi:hypothetical protein
MLFEVTFSAELAALMPEREILKLMWIPRLIPVGRLS